MLLRAANSANLTLNPLQPVRLHYGWPCSCLSGSACFKLLPVFFIETCFLHKWTIPPLTTNFHSFSVPVLFMPVLILVHLQLLIKFSYYFFLFCSSDHFFEWLSAAPFCLQHSFNFLVRPRLITDTVTNYNFLSFGISLEVTSWTEPQFLCSCFLRRYVAKK